MDNERKELYERVFMEGMVNRNHLDLYADRIQCMTGTDRKTAKKLAVHIVSSVVMILDVRGLLKEDVL